MVCSPARQAGSTWWTRELARHNEASRSKLPQDVEHSPCEQGPASQCWVSRLEMLVAFSTLPPFSHFPVAMIRSPSLTWVASISVALPWWSAAPHFVELSYSTVFAASVLRCRAGTADFRGLLLATTPSHRAI